MKFEPFRSLLFEKEELSLVPEKCGVYLLRDEGGKVIYVGKAVNVRARLRSHLQGDHLTPRLELMRRKARRLDLYLTENEKEAFILEEILIKKHRPFFNVLLRDDKTYPYIRISVQESFPKLSIVRQRKEDGAVYFGPYTSALKMKETISLIQDIFQLATCKITITGREPRPCLEYQIHRCHAPCTGYISQEEYRESVNKALAFLEGRQKDVVKELKRRMEEAAYKLAFEKAAQLRDKLLALESVIEKQKIVLPSFFHCDVAGWAQEGKRAVLGLFKVREGKLLDKENYFFYLPDDREVFLGEALRYVYGSKSCWPPVLLLPEQGDFEELRRLAEAHQSSIKLFFPRRGKKRELVKMAQENAQAFLAMSLEREKREGAKMQEVLTQVKTMFQLPSLPERIECIDISHFQGAEMVGSLVCFVNGRPEKSCYRRYQIKSCAGIHDPAALREVVKRRAQRGYQENNLPQLFLLDGGLPQLQAAQEALKELRLNIPCLALAKRAEIIYAPEGKTFHLPPSAAVLQLFQRIRDEAHRFALRYHQERLKKRLYDSPLLQIQGLGEKRRKAIVEKYLSSYSSWEVDGEKFLSELKLPQKVKEKVLFLLGERKG